jgi:hypothetical protein
MGSPWMSASGFPGSLVEAIRQGMRTMGFLGLALTRAQLLAAPGRLRRYAAREGRRNGHLRAISLRRINHISFELSAKIRFLPVGAGPAPERRGKAVLLTVEGSPDVVDRDQ